MFLITCNLVDIKKAEVGGVCSMCVREENVYRAWGENVALNYV
jgi:hypothetical protein